MGGKNVLQSWAPRVERSVRTICTATLLLFICLGPVFFMRLSIVSVISIIILVSEAFAVTAVRFIAAGSDV